MAVIHIEIVGRVQGIGFRWFVRERARRLDLAGWVKNLAGGTVEIAASGDLDAVADLVQHVRRGPPGATVQEVLEREPIAEIDLSKPFLIVR